MKKKFITHLAKLTGVAFIVTGLLAISTNSITPNLSMISIANASGTGGPIVLDGMDPICHAAYNENTDQYIAKVVKSVYDQSSMPGNNGKIAILGTGDTPGGCGGDWTTLLTAKFLTQFGTLASGLQPQVQFINSDTDLSAFFSSGITSAPPKMLWIPDDWSRSSAVNAIFTTNAEKIADFVNSGGGLFSSYNPYGWLTALLPSAVFNLGGCNGGPDATADGIADFGLSNTIVAACWHGFFTGNVGTLKTLVDYPYPSSSDTRKAVSIGGGSVSLPSSFTLAISPINPNAGDPLTITATAQTISGTPQSGVVVSMTVSSGPDTGRTFTATTNSSGIATIIVNTSSTGTNVYTATATVNGVMKTVSVTVAWNPPVTTVAPETTQASTSTTAFVAPSTTEAQKTVLPEITQAPSLTTVQEVEKTTTTVLVPNLEISSSSDTTIHDHSSHSHGPKLPNTGSELFSYMLIGFGLILLGLITRLGKKESR